MPGIPQSPGPPRKSAVTGQSPRNGLGMAGAAAPGLGHPTPRWGRGSAGAGGGQSSSETSQSRSWELRPGSIPSSAAAQGQAKSHALLPVIYLEHQRQSHGCSSASPELQTPHCCKGKCQHWLPNPAHLTVKFFSPEVGTKSSSRGWEALSRPSGCLYSH